MTLKPVKVFSAVHTVIIMLSLVSSPLAQIPRQRTGIQPAPQEPQETEEEKKAAKELEKKAMGLLDEMVAEAASLKLAENRVHILAGASDVLWERDEERARALVRESMNQAVAHMRETKEKAAQEDGQYFDSRYPRGYNASYLRHIVLNLLTRRDPKLALEFLQLTRSLQVADNARNSSDEQQEEKALELNLASQIAESDPQTALRIADDYLNGKLDYQVINLWSALQRKDPKAASALTEKIISGLKSQDILADYNASNFAFGVLSVLRSRGAEIANARNNPDASNAPQLNSAEIQQAYRDALEVVVAATLKITTNNMINQDEANKARGLLVQMSNYAADIEKILPARAAAVRAKVSQFDSAKYGSPYEKFYAEGGRDLHLKSLQELIALAPKAPQEFRQNIYYQAVNKAIEQGDEETARKIVKENIPDKWQANDLLSNLERRRSESAVGEGKYAEAKKSLARMRTDEQRASALAEWASAAAHKGDEKSAREMLGEARSLIGSRMQRSDQLEAQVAVASVAVSIDPDLSFEIAEAAVDRINRLVAANLEIQTFGGMEEGEVRIMDGGGWAGYSGSIVTLFAALAQKDFDRAVNLLKRWQLNELRLMISLSISQNILSGQGVVPVYSGKFVPGRGGVIRGTATHSRQVIVPLIRR